MLHDTIRRNLEQKKSENTVTIYQNGIGAFERTYDVKDHLTLKLPFKKDCIGDVAATLSILGPVDVVEAPNYPPTKEKPALEIDPKQATFDMFTKLSGSEVSITLNGGKEIVKGRVIGYQTENNILQGGQQITQHYLTVMSKDGSVRRLNFNNDVANYTFTDPTIQTLISKALDYNYEKINPESIYLTCGLKAEKPCKVMLKYTIPSPAFKLTYRLKQTIKGWTLYGYAVVDNNTDEDWTNFNINCATGQPVTFATDIADIRIPTRQKINLVTESAVGAVEVESQLEFLGGFETNRKTAARMMGGAAPMAASMAFGSPAPAPMQNFEEATQAIAASVEVGDATIFKGSEPVTIPAKKSALVKIIELGMKDAQFCLYYQPAINQERIMRALKMINEATYTLARGSVAIEQNGSHVGSAILSLSKPGEMAMLCHAQETGCKVVCEQSPERKMLVKHSLSEAVLISEWRSSRNTTYTFKNVKEEDFCLYFDHKYAYSGNTTTAVNGATESSKLKDNTVRYVSTIPAKGTLVITISESVLTHTSVKAGEFLDWMHCNPDSPLLKDRNLEMIINLNKQLETCGKEVNAATARLTALKGEQERIRKNCETLSKGESSQEKAQASDYRNRLIKSDEEINNIEQTKLPALEVNRQKLINQIREAVAQCTANWSSPLDERLKLQQK